mmetsp:Transcript_24097/g.50103  ORF Transcript_24097/g.50103 Transcript_24097/m.50103 type:complete len:101 (-) Transcript_24097:237-539(-)
MQQEQVPYASERSSHAWPRSRKGLAPPLACFVFDKASLQSLSAKQQRHPVLLPLPVPTVRTPCLGTGKPLLLSLVAEQQLHTVLFPLPVPSVMPLPSHSS